MNWLTEITSDELETVLLDPTKLKIISDLCLTQLLKFTPLPTVIASHSFSSIMLGTGILCLAHEQGFPLQGNLIQTWWTPDGIETKITNLQPPESNVVIITNNIITGNTEIKIANYLTEQQQRIVGIIALFATNSNALQLVKTTLNIPVEIIIPSLKG